MSKKILQDIVTPNRSIRRSDVYNNRNNSKKRSIFEDNQKNKPSYIKKSNTPRFIMWIFALISVIFLVFILLSIFSGTIVNVVPVERQVSLKDSQFIAKRDASDNKLSFKMIVLKNSDSMKIPATKEKELQKNASGSIIIYNAYSSRSQKLINKTRFEAPDGKIYRIKKSIVVPGRVVRDGKVIPGSVDAVVYSDGIGEKYNIGLVDFTIPGFKGGPMFSKFYARSKTLMSGGYSGVAKYASDEDISNALKNIKSTLENKLLSQAKLKVPDNFILYKDAVFFKFNNTTSQKVATGDSVSVTETGGLYAIILNKDELSKSIAYSSVNSYSGADVEVTNLDKMEFNIIDKEKFDPSSSNELNFKLSGPANIIWTIDKKSLAESIAGKEKKDFNDIISKYTSVDKADATIRPFWKSAFPKISKNITIKVLNSSVSAKEKK